MLIDGVSQSSGVERVLEVTSASDGVLFVIRDRIGNVERESLVLPTDDILTSLTTPRAGGHTIVGTSLKEGEKGSLAVEVRRNEVLLMARVASKQGWDVAVGLDDLMDAVEAASPS